jgi:hypothetical protein
MVNLNLVEKKKLDTPFDKNKSNRLLKNFIITPFRDKPQTVFTLLSLLYN